MNCRLGSKGNSVISHGKTCCPTLPLAKLFSHEIIKIPIWINGGVSLVRICGTCLEKTEACRTTLNGFMVKGCQTYFQYFVALGTYEIDLKNAVSWVRMLKNMDYNGFMEIKILKQLYYSFNNIDEYLSEDYTWYWHFMKHGQLASRP